MTRTRRAKVQAMLGLLLGALGILPAAVRGWPLIIAGVPIWVTMLGQALAVIAGGILVAGALAAFVSWRRGRTDA